jgi:hypothetical protein
MPAPITHFFLSGRCVRADAATDFTAFGVFALLSSFDAFEPTDFDVRSFFDISEVFRCGKKLCWTVDK